MNRAPSRSWITRGVVGIVLATFFSDVGHEMATATLPLYLGAIGLGAAALGVLEGLADLLGSLSKLAGAWVGHRSDRKRAWCTLGYLVTAFGTGAIALTRSLAPLVSFRSAAWMGRGFRSPLRDFMLSDEVGSTHFGRAYGIERAADMLGAVTGPLLAALLIWIGVDFHSIILASLAPSLVAALSFFALTRDRVPPPAEAAAKPTGRRLPRRFWLFVTGVALFGLGDFSRTFLIFIAAAAFAGGSGGAPGALSLAVLLYAAHNAVSALAAYPAGHLGDRGSKLVVLLSGYGLGIVTNVLLAVGSGSHLLLVLAILCSGVYIAVEETIEKALAAEMLPREQRSLGLGVLASANAIGDMLSSLGVGLLLASGHTHLAFLVPAVFGILGTVWMIGLARSGGTARPGL